MNTRKLFTTLVLTFVAVALSAQEARYEIKSGIIKKETSAMGQKFEATQYFDDYGKLESVEMSIKDAIAPGVDKHIRTITDSTSVTMIDLDLKTAQRMQLPMQPINYLKITDKMRQDYKLKESGEEVILGKTCKIYSAEISMMGQTATIKAWIWKGISLKTETYAGGMLAATELTTEFKENVAVSKEKLTVPEGVVVK
jgi:hypothetical protein